MTRLTVHLDVVYEVQGSLPDPGDHDASTALLEDLLNAGGVLDRLHGDDEGWRLVPHGWRVEVEGYGDLTVGPEAFEEGVVSTPIVSVGPPLDDEGFPSDEMLELVACSECGVLVEPRLWVERIGLAYIAYCHAERVHDGLVERVGWV